MQGIGYMIGGLVLKYGYMLKDSLKELSTLITLSTFHSLTHFFPFDARSKSGFNQ
jgi:triacylglycerol esterase/lipase EstA (alpha/beta hydrolase family)